MFTLEEIDLAIPPAHSSRGLVWRSRKQAFDWFRVVAEVSSGQLVPLPIPGALKEEHLLVERPIESCIQVGFYPVQLLGEARRHLEINIAPHLVSLKEVNPLCSRRVDCSI